MLPVHVPLLGALITNYERSGYVYYQLGKYWGPQLQAEKAVGAQGLMIEGMGASSSKDEYSESSALIGEGILPKELLLHDP